MILQMYINQESYCVQVKKKGKKMYDNTEKVIWYFFKERVNVMNEVDFIFYIMCYLWMVVIDIVYF